MYIQNTTITIPKHQISALLEELAQLGFDMVPHMKSPGNIRGVLLTNFRAHCDVDDITGDITKIFPDNTSVTKVRQFIKILAPFTLDGGRIIYEQTNRETAGLEIRSFLIQDKKVIHQREVKVFVDILEEEERKEDVR